MGKMDCAMEAMYMTDFFEALGFKRVRVMVDNNRGTVEVTLLKGRAAERKNLAADMERKGVF